MKFPVDLLADVSQAELEQSAHNYMNNLRYSNPDSPEYLTISGSTKVTINIASVGFVPLFGSSDKQKILAVFSPTDPLTHVGLYLLDQWWAVEDILKTADPARDGAVEVKTVGERIVLYILNRIIYRAKEMSSEELPFLCHGEKDYAKILWNKGEAVGFYSVKPSGSICNPFSSRTYQLPVMNSIFVRKWQRGKGFGLQMLVDFVLSFNTDALGLRYPLTKSMYKVCEKYLRQYPGDRDLLWEVESTGGPNQRTNIARKIQAMDFSGKTEQELVVHCYTKEADDVPVAVQRKEVIEKMTEQKLGKVIRIEDIEAETPEEERVSVQQMTEQQDVSELEQTEVLLNVAEEKGEDVVDTASEEEPALVSDKLGTIPALKDLEEAEVTLATMSEKSEEATQDLNTSHDSQLIVENVVSQTQEADEESQNEAETLGKLKEEIQITVSDKLSEEKVGEHELSLSARAVSEDGDAGKRRIVGKAIKPVQRETRSYKSQQQTSLYEVTEDITTVDGKRVLRGRTVMTTFTPKRKYTRHTQEVRKHLEKQLSESAEGNKPTAEVVEECGVTGEEEKAEDVVAVVGLPEEEEHLEDEQLTNVEETEEPQGESNIDKESPTELPNTAETAHTNGNEDAKVTDECEEEPKEEPITVQEPHPTKPSEQQQKQDGEHTEETGQEASGSTSEDKENEQQVEDHQLEQEETSGETGQSKSTEEIFVEEAEESAGPKAEEAAEDSVLLTETKVDADETVDEAVVLVTEELQEKDVGLEMPKLQKASIILVDLKTTYHLHVEESEKSQHEGESVAEEEKMELIAEEIKEDEQTGALMQMLEEESGNKKESISDKYVDPTAEAEKKELETDHSELGAEDGDDTKIEERVLETRVLRSGRKMIDASCKPASTIPQQEKDTSEKEVDEKVTVELEGEMEAVTEDSVITAPEEEKEGAVTEMCVDTEADIPVEDCAEEKLSAEVGEEMSLKKDETPPIEIRTLRSGTLRVTTTTHKRESVGRRSKQHQKKKEDPKELEESGECLESPEGQPTENNNTEIVRKELVTTEDENGTIPVTEKEENAAGATAAADGLEQEDTTDTPLTTCATDSATTSSSEEVATPSMEDQPSQVTTAQLSTLQRLTVVLVDLRKTRNDIPKDTAAVEGCVPVETIAVEGEEEQTEETRNEEKAIAEECVLGSPMATEETELEKVVVEEEEEFEENTNKQLQELKDEEEGDQESTAIVEREEEKKVEQAEEDSVIDQENGESLETQHVENTAPEMGTENSNHVAEEAVTQEAPEVVQTDSTEIVADDQTKVPVEQTDEGQTSDDVAKDAVPGQDGVGESMSEAAETAAAESADEKLSTVNDDEGKSSSEEEESLIETRVLRSGAKRVRAMKRIQPAKRQRKKRKEEAAGGKMTSATETQVKETKADPQEAEGQKETSDENTEEKNEELEASLLEDENTEPEAVAEVLPTEQEEVDKETCADGQEEASVNEDVEDTKVSDVEEAQAFESNAVPQEVEGQKETSNENIEEKNEELEASSLNNENTEPEAVAEVLPTEQQEVAKEICADGQEEASTSNDAEDTKVSDVEDATTFETSDENTEEKNEELEASLLEDENTEPEAVAEVLPTEQQEVAKEICADGQEEASTSNDAEDTKVSDVEDATTFETEAVPQEAEGQKETSDENSEEKNEELEASLLEDENTEPEAVAEVLPTEQEAVEKKTEEHGEAPVREHAEDTKVSDVEEATTFETRILRSGKKRSSPRSKTTIIQDIDGQGEAAGEKGAKEDEPVVETRVLRRGRRSAAATPRRNANKSRGRKGKKEEMESPPTTEIQVEETKDNTDEQNREEAGSQIDENTEPLINQETVEDEQSAVLNSCADGGGAEDAPSADVENVTCEEEEPLIKSGTTETTDKPQQEVDSDALAVEPRVLRKRGRSAPATPRRKSRRACTRPKVEEEEETTPDEEQVEEAGEELPEKAEEEGKSTELEVEKEDNNTDEQNGEEAGSQIDENTEPPINQETVEDEQSAVLNSCADGGGAEDAPSADVENVSCEEEEPLIKSGTTETDETRQEVDSDTLAVEPRVLRKRGRSAPATPRRKSRRACTQPKVEEEEKTTPDEEEQVEEAGEELPEKAEEEGTSTELEVEQEDKNTDEKNGEEPGSQIDENTEPLINQETVEDEQSAVLNSCADGGGAEDAPSADVEDVTCEEEEPLIILGITETTDKTQQEVDSDTLAVEPRVLRKRGSSAPATPRRKSRRACTQPKVEEEEKTTPDEEQVEEAGEELPEKAEEEGKSTELEVEKEDNNTDEQNGEEAGSQIDENTEPPINQETVEDEQSAVLNSCADGGGAEDAPSADVENVSCEEEEPLIKSGTTETDETRQEVDSDTLAVEPRVLRKRGRSAPATPRRKSRRACTQPKVEEEEKTTPDEEEQVEEAGEELPEKAEEEGTSTELEVEQEDKNTDEKNGEEPGSQIDENTEPLINQETVEDEQSAVLNSCADGGGAEDAPSADVEDVTCEEEEPLIILGIAETTDKTQQEVDADALAVEPRVLRKRGRSAPATPRRKSRRACTQPKVEEEEKTTPDEEQVEEAGEELPEKAEEEGKSTELEVEKEDNNTDEQNGEEAGSQIDENTDPLINQETLEDEQSAVLNSCADGGGAEDAPGADVENVTCEEEEPLIKSGTTETDETQQEVDSDTLAVEPRVLRKRGRSAPATPRRKSRRACTRPKVEEEEETTPDEEQVEEAGEELPEKAEEEGTRTELEVEKEDNNTDEQNGEEAGPQIDENTEPLINQETVEDEQSAVLNSCADGGGAEDAPSADVEDVTCEEEEPLIILGITETTDKTQQEVDSDALAVEPRVLRKRGRSAPATPRRKSRRACTQPKVEEEEETTPDEEQVEEAGEELPEKAEEEGTRTELEVEKEDNNTDEQNGEEAGPQIDENTEPLINQETVEDEQSAVLNSCADGGGAEDAPSADVEDVTCEEEEPLIILGITETTDKTQQEVDSDALAVEPRVLRKRGRSAPATPRRKSRRACTQPKVEEEEETTPDEEQVEEAGEELPEKAEEEGKSTELEVEKEDNNTDEQNGEEAGSQIDENTEPPINQETVEDEQSAVLNSCADSGGAEDAPSADVENVTCEEEEPLIKSGITETDETQQEVDSDTLAVEPRVLRKRGRSAPATPRRKSRRACTQPKVEEEEETTPDEEEQVEEAGEELPEKAEEEGKSAELEVEKGEEVKELDAESVSGQESAVGGAEQMKDALIETAAVLEEEDKGEDGIEKASVETKDDEVQVSSVEVEESNSAEEEETTVMETSTAVTDEGSDTAVAEEAAEITDASVVAEEEAPAMERVEGEAVTDMENKDESEQEGETGECSANEQIEKLEEDIQKENIDNTKGAAESTSEKVEVLNLTLDSDEEVETAGVTDEQSEEEAEPIVIGQKVLRGRSIPSVIITPRAKGRRSSTKVEKAVDSSPDEKGSPQLSQRKSLRKRKSTEVTPARKSKRHSRE